MAGTAAIREIIPRRKSRPERKTVLPRREPRQEPEHEPPSMNPKVYARRLLCGALPFVFGAAASLFAQSLACRALAAQTVGESHTRIHDPEAEALQKLLADAQAALDANNYAVAAEKYQEYLAKQPDDAVAHFQLGYAYTALQRPADAKTEYARAVELDPKMAPAYLNLGM